MNVSLDVEFDRYGLECRQNWEFCPLSRSDVQSRNYL